MEQRIQKIIAEMGLASRRHAEELITEGRVTVNGKVAQIGMKADLFRDHIKVDGKLLTRPEKKVYYVFHKPRGVVTSMSDPEGRPTVHDFLRGIKQRVFPVGRLDYDSEGMLLLTNDGDFSHAVLHPSRKIPKTYLVKVKGVLEEEDLERLRNGIRLDRIVTAPAKVKRLRKTEQNSWIEMTIFEGKKRQIRRMLERVGHPVMRLMRVKISSIDMGELKPGTYRHMTPEEMKTMLKELNIGEDAACFGIKDAVK
ncbi:MAG: rRNA pseudouridine synthase [Nitrospirae bacterium]|nr:rRNA pseudouridine synthase [Nitrospirota bacterium]